MIGTIIELLKWLGAGIAASYTWIFGTTDAIMFILIAFIVADYLSGMIVAVFHKNLDSKVGFKGLARKILIFLLVGIAALLDRLLVGSNGALKAAVCAFYISNEGLSIFENAAKIGLPIPKVLRATLEQLHEKTAQNNTKHN